MKKPLIALLLLIILVAGAVTLGVGIEAMG